MTERADILRLQAEIRELGVWTMGCDECGSSHPYGQHRHRKIGTAESVILAAIFFIPATYIVGKFLGVW